MENKHTYKEYKFPNGETIKCTVAFRFMIMLRERNEKIYERLNKGLLFGVKDFVDAIYVLYGAYLCACIAGENGGEAAIMGESEFIDKLDDDLLDVMILCNSLINKKKN